MEEIKVVKAKDIKEAIVSYSTIISNGDEYVTTIKVIGYKGTLHIVFVPYEKDSDKPRVYVAFEEADDDQCLLVK